MSDRRVKHFVVGKGSPPAPPQPVRTPDNLRSQDTIEVLLGIGEGPNKGIVGGAQGFYIGETQLENSDGNANFQNFKLTEYHGQPGETVTMTLGGQARSRGVSVTLAKNTPIIRQTMFGNIDFIEFRFVIGRLYSQNDSGIFGSDLEFKIELKPHSSAEWTNPFEDPSIILKGKTTSNYVKEIRVPVTRIDEPYDLRVTKLSDDSDSLNNFRDITWESYQEVDGEVKTYADLAMVHLVGQASDQFSSIPEFKSIWDLLVINVPSNYDPVAHTTTGVWDGTFNKEWSNCGPWCLYDYVTNDRYGVSAYFPITLDKWDVYEAAAWCDTMVSDGQGGMEPRWTFNSLIADARSGKEMAAYIAGTFNGILIDGQDGTTRLKIDKDDDAVHLFTPENVVNGKFEYAYTDLNSRYNDIIVRFTNPDLNWEEDYRRIEDRADIALNGRITLDFVAVGCTKEREALRRGQYKLITALTETEIVRFQINRLGQSVSPFDIMLVGDPKMGYSLTGRAKGFDGTLTQINLRDPVHLEVGISYTLRAFSPSQGIFTRTVTTATTGDVMSLTVDSALPADVDTYMTFSLEQTGAGYGAPKPYRVVKVEEVDGNPDLFTVEGIEVNRNKWNDVDNLTYEGTLIYSQLPTPLIIPGPTAVGFKAQYFRTVAQKQLYVEPTFDRKVYPYYNGDFDVYSRPQNTTGAWTKWTLINGDTIVGHPEGDYDFRIAPYNYFGAVATVDQVASFPYKVSFTIPKPGTVTGFFGNVTYAGLVLGWNLNSEPDLEYYEIREGTSWDSGTVVVTGLKSDRFVLPKKKLGTITYHIAAHAAGKFSAPASITLTLLAPATVKDFQVVQNNDQLQFHWTANSEPDIDIYEIREGASWTASARVTQVSSTRWSMPSNTQATRQFWIKARDKSGNYSVLSASDTTVAIPTERTNVINTYPESDNGFPAFKLNVSVDPQGALVLNEGEIYGEYVHEADLGGSVYARNVLEITQDVIRPGDTLTWDDATFSWDDATRPWSIAGDFDNITFATDMSIHVGLAGYGGLPGDVVEAWRLNNTLVGERGTDVSVPSEHIYYADGRFTTGLNVIDAVLDDDTLTWDEANLTWDEAAVKWEDLPGTQATWAVAVPSRFKLDFWYRPAAVNVKAGLLQLTGASGEFLQVYFDGSAATPVFGVIDNLGNNVQIAAFPKVTIGELIRVTLVQTDTMRKLLVGRLYDQTTMVASGAVAPAALDALTTSVAVGFNNRANGVLSDVVLTNDLDITTSDFITSITKVSAPGYRDWRTFVAGDYSYDKALFREVLMTSAVDLPRVTSLKLSVDVPDVIDRSAAIVDITTAEPVTIDFNRSFTVAPDVFPKITTAANGVKLVLGTVTKDSFVIEARDSNDQLTTASFSWVAHGY